MTFKDYIKEPLVTQHWEYWGGDTWNPLIHTFCKKHGISAKHDTDSPYDLVVYVTRDGQQEKYMFELKYTDLYSSVFSKDTTTSLEGELRGYITQDPDFLYLIYVIPDGVQPYLHYRLDNLLADYPTCRRKSYKKQESAIDGIFRIIQKGAKPLNFKHPVYENWKSLSSTCAKMFRVIDGVSPEKANALAEYYDYCLGNYYIEDYKGKSKIDHLRTFYPDTKQGYHFMVNNIYDHLESGIEPKANKMGKTTPKLDDEPHWSVI